jgi:hypothetical protein
MKKQLSGFVAVVLLGLLFSACQKIEQPGLGDFPRDSNPPGGPLNFYVAFDGTTADPLMNAVDSIRANFASENPLASTDGISGKAIQGENKKFIKYTQPNDWAGKAKSFTIAVWFKHNGQTKNNVGGNGPAHIISFPAKKVDNNDYHWSSSNTLVFLEGDNAACAVKVMMVDANRSDNWMTWEGGGSIPGLMNNNWHHLALIYDAGTSKLTLYIDGVANSNQKQWAGHGNINLDAGAIREMRVGAGPKDDLDTNDWLSSTFKGSLDQLRMYSTALTAAEVQALFVGKK